jgi:hypothetical protein
MRIQPTIRRGALVATVLMLAASTACSGTQGSSGSSSSSASSAPQTTPASATHAASSRPPKNAASSQSPVPIESNPPGDIPDNLAFVRYTNKAGGYTFTHPEGWARTSHGSHVQFTDKLNGVTVESLSATRAPTVRSAQRTEVSRLTSSVPAFRLRAISTAQLPGGRGVHIVFRRNSTADPVTGKVYRDEVQEYVVYAHRRLVRMDLFGPVGADNVDAYRTMSTSLHIS